MSTECDPSTLVRCNDGGLLVVGGTSTNLKQEQVRVRNGGLLAEPFGGEELFWEYGYALSMTKQDADTEFFGVGVACFDCDQYNDDDPSDLEFSITSMNIRNANGVSWSGFRQFVYFAFPVKYTSQVEVTNSYGDVEIKSWYETENMISLDGFTVYAQTMPFVRVSPPDWTNQVCSIYGIARIPLPSGVGGNVRMICSARMRPEVADQSGGANFYSLHSFYTSTRLFAPSESSPPTVCTFFLPSLCAGFVLSSPPTTITITELFPSEVGIFCESIIDRGEVAASFFWKILMNMPFK